MLNHSFTHSAGCNPAVVKSIERVGWIGVWKYCLSHTLCFSTQPKNRSNIVFMVKLLMKTAKDFELESLHPDASCLLVYHNFAIARSRLYNKMCTIVFNCQREFYAKIKVRIIPHSHVIKHSVLYFTCTYTQAHLLPWVYNTAFRSWITIHCHSRLVYITMPPHSWFQGSVTQCGTEHGDKTLPVSNTDAM